MIKLRISPKVTATWDHNGWQCSSKVVQDKLTRSIPEETFLPSVVNSIHGSERVVLDAALVHYPKAVPLEVIVPPPAKLKKGEIH